jgi:TPR repeat protein
LANIAITDEDQYVRHDAKAKVTDQEVLLKIDLEDRNRKVKLNDQVELAVKLIAGAGVQKDEDQAVRLLTFAAHAGHIEAQELLGSTLRHRGEIAEAVVWLRKAADAGASGAQLELGMVFCSHDTYRDYSKANEFWRAAIRAGNDEQKGVAFANLGMLYGNGMGVKRSPTKAIFLLSAALNVGNKPAQDIIAEFVPKLAQSTPSAISQMMESIKKLDALAASGDRTAYCSWAIDNLDSMT